MSTSFTILPSRIFEILEIWPNLKIETFLLKISGLKSFWDEWDVKFYIGSQKKETQKLSTNVETVAARILPAQATRGDKNTPQTLTFLLTDLAIVFWED